MQDWRIRNKLAVYRFKIYLIFFYDIMFFIIVVCYFYIVMFNENYSFIFDYLILFNSQYTIQPNLIASIQYSLI